jgi:two-component system nitrogen regulation response regulator GlnG
VHAEVSPDAGRSDWNILGVDDEPTICSLLARLLRKEGMTVEVAHDGKTALEALRKQPPDLLLLDYRLPDMTGQDVLLEARALMPNLPIIVITAYADVQTAVKSMQAGAVDYLAKPFDHKHLLRLIDSTIMHRGAAPGVVAPRPMAPTSGLIIEPLEDVMGRSSAIRKLASNVRRVASTRFNVLVMGETGTGKELVSRAIHQYSFHGQGPFVAVDCGALPENLLESELFGHERGAFTGAVARKIGKFEQASGGTLFLDEISNLSWSAQASLLRAIQERVIFRVGGTEPIQVKVRIVAACNLELRANVAQSKFRDDLYFRLSEFNLRTPSLRERAEDIPFLVQRFLRETNNELCKAVRGLSAAAETMLMQHVWPGNVRELRNVVRQAALLADDLIDVEHIRLESAGLPAEPRGGDRPPADPGEWSDMSLRQIVRRQTAALERDILVQALGRT